MTGERERFCHRCGRALGPDAGWFVNLLGVDGQDLGWYDVGPECVQSYRGDPKAAQIVRAAQHDHAKGQYDTQAERRMRLTLSRKLTADQEAMALRWLGHDALDRLRRRMARATSDEAIERLLNEAAEAVKAAVRSIEAGPMDLLDQSVAQPVAQPVGDTEDPPAGGSATEAVQ